MFRQQPGTADAGRTERFTRRDPGVRVLRFSPRFGIGLLGVGGWVEPVLSRWSAYDVGFGGAEFGV